MNGTDGRQWRAVVAGLAVVAGTVVVTVLATLALTGDNEPANPSAAQPSSSAVPPTAPPTATGDPATTATATHSPAPSATGSGRGWKETGFLTGVQRSGGRLTVTVDRVIFLTGDDAVEANGGARTAIARGGKPSVDLWHRPAPGNSVTWLSEHWLP